MNIPIYFYWFLGGLYWLKKNWMNFVARLSARATRTNDYKLFIIKSARHPWHHPKFLPLTALPSAEIILLYAVQQLIRATENFVVIGPN